ncbi:MULTISPECIES: type II toxin-antitoxin system Phd/YefM family antitoxin [unclassified Frankia]|uniref:type II toxin-antitoxin system Phd/YefM family antitoxin n=1 Tax=unclassified Frankia TaxID=2632575 RepID=UPI002024B395
MVTKVGIREFRAGLADYIASDEPVAVTRHGRTVGYFIPAKSDLDAELAALKAAAAALDGLLAQGDVEVDAVVSEFKAARRKRPTA